MRTSILSPVQATPLPALVNLLSSPLNSLFDLSYINDASGLSLLHEAARGKDAKLVEPFTGADVFVLNRKDKSVMNAAGKGDHVKAYLRQFANPTKPTPNRDIVSGIAHLERLLEQIHQRQAKAA